MSSSKQAPKSGGWGSLFSNAVANLESRLDVILADDAEASARERAAEKTKKDVEGRGRANSGALSTTTSKTHTPNGREGSGPRNNDRLAERLAKAAAARSSSQTASTAPSRTNTPAPEAAKDRSSIEVATPESSVVDVAIPEQQAPVAPEVALKAVSGDAIPSSSGSPSSLLVSGLPINPARLSTDSPRPSLDLQSNAASSRPSIDLAGDVQKAPESDADPTTDDVETLETYKQRERQRQEEMHAYLEKIDALQAKLQYLAKESVAAAREANASASAGSEKAQLAEKDEKIALLMVEGEKLSKSEMKHLQTIKKLRLAATEEEKANKELRRKHDRFIKLESDLKHKLQRSEVAQRQAEEKANQIQEIAQQVDELKADREAAAELVRNLTVQLKEAKERADRVELAQKDPSNKSSESDRNKIASLENELEDALIEKKLAADRAHTEKTRLQEDLEQSKQTSELREIELKSEIGGLESRLEALRSRAEEASSDAVSDTGNIKLIRQVETLQSQYSLAKENWETIENALNSRLSALENERDESNKREADLRKKYREVSARCRKAEDELESSSEQARRTTQELKSQQEELESLTKAHKEAKDTLMDANAQLEQHQKTLEQTVQQRLEEERARYLPSPPVHATTSYFRGIDSPTNSRKNSNMMDFMGGAQSSRRNGTRNVGQDLPIETSRLSTRRNSAMPSPALRNPQPISRSREDSPSISRQASQVALDLAPESVPATPSIEVDQYFDSASPQRTINDLVSTSTAGAGPSVQLVERLSLAVRRLESEKATFKDELTRLATQRDDARSEIVTLMRELDSRKKQEQQVADVDALRKRYEASLEMLGEREEEIQELKQDMKELKQMYKDLLEDKVGPGAK